MSNKKKKRVPERIVPPAPKEPDVKPPSFPGIEPDVTPKPPDIDRPHPAYEPEGPPKPPGPKKP